MKRTLTIVVLLLAGAWGFPGSFWGVSPASAQTYWDKPGNQPGEFERDKAECLAIWGQEGRRAMQAWEFDGCLVAHGWQVVRQGPVQVPMMPPAPIYLPPPPVFVNPGIEAGRGMIEGLQRGTPPPPVQCFTQPNGRGWSTTCH